MTPLLHTVLFIVTLLFTTTNGNRVYECHDSSCYVNCTRIGCSNFDILNVSNAQQATVECTSLNPYTGGCSLLSILCPSSGDCTINCNDYYGCYGTNITVASNSHPTVSTSLTLNCNHPDSSCADTIINAPHIDSLTVNCVGSNNSLPLSLSSVTCHNMLINANHAKKHINIHCLSDYACSNNILYANHSNSKVSIRAIGLFSFYQNVIHASQSSAFSLFCGSEAYAIYGNDQFGGCSGSTFYLPSYATRTSPRASIKCEGEGCYNLDIFAVNGAWDVNLTMNACSECDRSSCINEWIYHCGNNYETESVFSGDLCTGDCDCKHAVYTASASFVDNDMMCSIFEMDFICESDADCVIDCSTHEVFKHDGCNDKLIHGANAKSLSVECKKDKCRKARISCPDTMGSNCDITCIGAHSCYELEIHATQNTKQLNISCVGKDACSFIEVNALRTEQIYMNCIVSDACDNFNIFANYSDVLKLKCEPQDIDTTNDIYSSAYAACNNFNIYAPDNDELIDIECNGDFSCYHANIYADNAHDLRVNAEGEYALYYGHLHASNILHNFSLSCRSEFGEQSCYRSSIYAPQYNDYDINNAKRMNIMCEGHGCMYLNVFAVNGWSDVDIRVDGCSECESIDDCVNNWYMHCGGTDSDINTAVFDGLECDTSKCDCDLMKESVEDTFSNHAFSECGFFTPDIVCEVDTECVIDCNAYKGGCDHKIITGSEAKSIVVNCNDANGCIETQIYCPIDTNSRCDVKCVNPKSCYLTQIYGDEYNLINVDCIASNACVNTTIAAPDANEVNVLCMESNACQHINMDATYVAIVNMICSWNQSHACDNIHIVATHSRNKVNIECDGAATCKQLYVDAQNAHTINVNAVGSLALFSGVINGASAKQFNALLYAKYPSKYAAGRYQDGDYDAYDNGYFVFYLPAKQDNYTSSITCKGYACYSLNIASANGLIDYDFHLNGCGFCNELFYCYYDWNIMCGDPLEDKLTVWKGGYCYDDACGCFESMKSIQSVWDNENTATCEDIGTFKYECGSEERGYCSINCADAADESSSCRNKVINATDVSDEYGVIINCGGDGYNYYASCANTKIYCPKQGNCVVNCLSDDSCTYASIYSDSLDKLRLNCSDYGSCEYTKVIAPHARQMDLICDSTDSCYGVNVNASHADTVNIVCKSSQKHENYYNYYDYDDYYPDYGYYDDYEEYDDDDDGWRRRRRRLQTNRKKPVPPPGEKGDYTSYSDPYTDTIDYPIDDWYKYPSYSGAFACDQIVVDANYSTNVSILCEGDQSCYSSVFYATYVTRANVTALGIDAFDYDTLFANKARNVYVTCGGLRNDSEYATNMYSNHAYGRRTVDVSGACIFGNFHIPSAESGVTKFVCKGYSCYDLNIFSEKGLIGVTINIDGCHVCDSIHECIFGWNVMCGYESDRYIDGNCTYGDCECSDNNLTYHNTYTCGNGMNDNNNYNATIYPYPWTPHMVGTPPVIFIVLGCVILAGILCCIRNKRLKQNMIRNQVNAVANSAPVAVGMNYVNDNNIVAIEAVEGQITAQQCQVSSVSTVNPQFIARPAKERHDDGNIALINN